MSKTDPRGYYAALGLSPGANEVEIGMAFRARKRAYLERRLSLDIGKVQTAYETLRDPRSRRDYDEGKTPARGGMHLSFSLPRLSPGQKAAITAAVLAVVLTVFVGFQHRATIRGAFVRFEPGDALVEVHSGNPLGEVAQYDTNHTFPAGGETRAYLVVRDDGQRKWYPAKDLERNCSKR